MTINNDVGNNIDDDADTRITAAAAAAAANLLYIVPQFSTATEA